MKRRSGEDHSSSTLVLLDFLHQLAIEILQPMPFVNYDIAPVVLGEVHPVTNDDVVGRYNDGERQ